MNDEPPRKKTFWELYAGLSGQRAIAAIMALSLGLTLIILAITGGIAMLINKFEVTGVVADMFKLVLGAMVGALSVYLGIRTQNGEAPK